MQDPSVDLDIQMVRGFRNMLFGGEGLILATLTEPGRIWLQSMPILNLAEEIARDRPSRQAEGIGLGATAGRVVGGAAGAAIGGLLGGLFSNE